MTNSYLDANKWIVDPEREQPNDCDVILGRGKHGEGWPGNIRFRKLVNENAAAYCFSQRFDQRDAIANGIIAAIEGTGGKFLQMPKRAGDPQVLISKAATRVKVKQALRDRMKPKAGESKRQPSFTMSQQAALSVSDHLWNIEPTPIIEDSTGCEVLTSASGQQPPNNPFPGHARPSANMDQHVNSRLPQIEDEPTFSSRRLVLQMHTTAPRDQNLSSFHHWKHPRAESAGCAVIPQSALDVSFAARKRWSNHLQPHQVPSKQHEGKNGALASSYSRFEQERRKLLLPTLDTRDDDVSSSSTLDYDWDSDDLFLSEGEDAEDDDDDADDQYTSTPWKKHSP